MLQQVAKIVETLHLLGALLIYLLSPTLQSKYVTSEGDSHILNDLQAKTRNMCYPGSHKESSFNTSGLSVKCCTPDLHKGSTAGNDVA